MRLLEQAWAAGDLDYPSFKILAEAAARLQERAYSAEAGALQTPANRLK